tara:strand:- start:13 stop:462 length:450 start_codon:yes stop_codon:yes gene_type:complete
MLCVIQFNLSTRKLVSSPYAGMIRIRFKGSPRRSLVKPQSYQYLSLLNKAPLGMTLVFQSSGARVKVVVWRLFDEAETQLELRDTAALNEKAIKGRESIKGANSRIGGNSSLWYRLAIFVSIVVDCVNSRQRFGCLPIDLEKNRNYNSA